MRVLDRRRVRRVLPAGVAATLFVVVLVLWTASGRVHASGDRDLATASSGHPAIPDPAGGAQPAFSSGTPPDLTQISGGVGARVGVAHRVTLSAKSDAAIGQLYYFIRGGDPEKGKLVSAASPVTITSAARGVGLIAEIWMQSSIYAGSTTCTITVDGQVRSTRTVTGGYNVAICIA